MHALAVLLRVGVMSPIPPTGVPLVRLRPDTVRRALPAPPGLLE